MIGCKYDKLATVTDQNLDSKNLQDYLGENELAEVTTEMDMDSVVFIRREYMCRKSQVSNIPIYLEKSLALSIVNIKIQRNSFFKN